MLPPLTTVQLKNSHRQREHCKLRAHFRHGALPMFKRSSLTWPITLAAVLLPLIVALLVIWIIGQAAEHRWALLTVGTVFITLILIGVVVYFIWTVKEFR